MNKFNFLALFCLIVITGCGKNTNPDKGNKNIPTVELHKLADHKSEKLLAHELFSDIRIIRPETGEQSLIGRYYSVKAYKNHLLINSESKSLHVYDFNGRFLFKTKQGKGPDEFVEISDFAIDTGSDEVLILDSPRKRVLRLNLEGNVQDAFRLKESVTNMAYVGEDKCCYYVPFNFYAQNGKHGDYFFIADKIGNISDSLFIERKISKSPWVTMVNFVSNKGSVYFQPSHYDTVFTVSNCQFKPALILDYGNYRMPFKYIASLKTRRKHANKYLHLGSIFHTPGHLIIGYKFQGPFNYAIYNKKTKTFQVAAVNREQRKTGIIFGSGDKSLYLRLHSVYKGNKVVMSCMAQDVMQYLKNYNNLSNGFYEPLIDTLQKVKENDNPVFFIGEFRENS